MKINHIINETTTAGSVATVSTPLGGTQSRGNSSIYGGKKVGTLLKGKKTSKPYANSLNEAAMKDLEYDLQNMKPAEFQKKYGKTREEMKAAMSKQPAQAPVNEADLQEDDVILIPGQGRKMKTGFVPHGKSRVDHEVEMARSDLFSAAKNAQQVYAMIKDVSEDEGLDGWVQEKIIKANDYLNTIREYLEGKQVQGVDESIENNSVANALINYIMKNRPDLLKHGADRVGDAIDRIASNVRDINSDNIGKVIKQIEYYVTSNNHDMYESSQRGDTLVTDALKIMRGAEVNDAVKALKTVLGDREYNSRRGFYNFYVKQMLDMYGQQGIAEELSMSHQRDHKTQKYPDNSNSLANRSFSQAERPNVSKTADGHPTVKYRTDSTGKAGQTRVEPSITQTRVKRKDSDRPVPSFLQKNEK